MLYYLFAVVYVLSCFLLLLVVLLQQGKGGDMPSTAVALVRTVAPARAPNAV